MNGSLSISLRAMFRFRRFSCLNLLALGRPTVDFRASGEESLLGRAFAYSPGGTATRTRAGRLVMVVKQRACFLARTRACAPRYTFQGFAPRHIAARASERLVKWGKTEDCPRARVPRSPSSRPAQQHSPSLRCLYKSALKPGRRR